MKATYQAGRVQALDWRARDEYYIYFYFGQFLLYSPFVIYRLPQTGSGLGAVEQKAFLSCHL